MFGIKKNKNQAVNQNQVPVLVSQPIQVHVMPDKFLSGKTNSHVRNKTNYTQRTDFNLKKNILWGLVIIVGLGLLMFLAGWLFMKSIKQTPQDQNKAPTQQPEKQVEQSFVQTGTNPQTEQGDQKPATSTSTLTQPVRWLTYQNYSFGFSLKYPDSWQIDSSQTFTGTLVFRQPNSTESVTAIQLSMSLDDWLESLDVQDISQTSNISINGQVALRVDMQDKNLIKIAFSRQGFFFVIQTNGKMIENGMLDTFEFIEIQTQPEYEDDKEVVSLNINWKKISSSLDSDQDGLTDVEEGLYSSDPKLPDTDQDGYLDGEELVDLYNPLKPAQKLESSGLVNKYTNTKFGYIIFYPLGWSQAALDTSQETIIFTSETTEFIEVIVQENLTGITNIRSWYLSQMSGIEPSRVANVIVDGLAGVTSPDGMNIYFMKDNLIYIISYNINLKETANYPKTFEMMVNSFKFFENPLD